MDESWRLYVYVFQLSSGCPGLVIDGNFGDIPALRSKIKNVVYS